MFTTSSNVNHVIGRSRTLDSFVQSVRGEFFDDSSPLGKHHKDVATKLAKMASETSLSRETVSCQLVDSTYTQSPLAKGIGKNYILTKAGKRPNADSFTRRALGTRLEDRKSFKLFQQNFAVANSHNELLTMQMPDLTGRNFYASLVHPKVSFIPHVLTNDYWGKVGLDRPTSSAGYFYDACKKNLEVSYEIDAPNWMVIAIGKSTFGDWPEMLRLTRGCSDVELFTMLAYLLVLDTEIDNAYAPQVLVDNYPDRCDEASCKALCTYLEIPYRLRCRRLALTCIDPEALPLRGAECAVKAKYYDQRVSYMVHSSLSRMKSMLTGGIATEHEISKNCSYTVSNVLLPVATSISMKVEADVFKSWLETRKNLSVPVELRSANFSEKRTGLKPVNNILPRELDNDVAYYSVLQIINSSASTGEIYQFGAKSYTITKTVKGSHNIELYRADYYEYVSFANAYARFFPLVYLNSLQRECTHLGATNGEETASKSSAIASEIDFLKDSIETARADLLDLENALSQDENIRVQTIADERNKASRVARSSRNVDKQKKTIAKLEDDLRDLEQMLNGIHLLDDLQSALNVGKYLKRVVVTHMHAPMKMPILPYKNTWDLLSLWSVDREVAEKFLDSSIVNYFSYISSAISNDSAITCPDTCLLFTRDNKEFKFRAGEEVSVYTDMIGSNFTRNVHVTYKGTVLKNVPKNMGLFMCKLYTLHTSADHNLAIETLTNSLENFQQKSYDEAFGLANSLQKIIKDDFLIEFKTLLTNLNIHKAQYGSRAGEKAELETVRTQSHDNIVMIYNNLIDKINQEIRSSRGEDVSVPVKAINCKVMPPTDYTGDNYQAIINVLEEYDMYANPEKTIATLRQRISDIEYASTYPHIGKPEHSPISVSDAFKLGICTKESRPNTGYVAYEISAIQSIPDKIESFTNEIRLAISDFSVADQASDLTDEDMNRFVRLEYIWYELYESFEIEFQSNSHFLDWFAGVVERKDFDDVEAIYSYQEALSMLNSWNDEINSDEYATSVHDLVQTLAHYYAVTLLAFTHVDNCDYPDVANAACKVCRSTETLYGQIVLSFGDSFAHAECILGHQHENIALMAYALSIPDSIKGVLTKQAMKDIEKNSFAVEVARSSATTMFQKICNVLFM